MTVPKLRRRAAWSIVAIVFAAPSFGQETLPPDLAQELRGIRQNLARLVELREQEARYDKSELILRQIELAERRLEPLDSRLHRAEAQVEKELEGIEVLERLKAQHDAVLEEEIREGADVPRSDTRKMLADIECSFGTREDQLANARARVVELENDLARGRKVIELLEERLTELLDEE